MSFSSLFLTLRHGLPRPTNKVRVRRHIAVTMPDGVKLMTDHYAPVLPGKHPTILMRLPYGRQGFGTLAELYAERGFQVVLQACRGTEDSQGVFDPLSNEREDGLATLAWLRKQAWFDGRLGLSGPSYLGYCQWAICDAPEVKVMSTKITSAEFRSVVFPNGAFNLGLALGWLQTIEALRGSGLLFLARMLSGDIERRTRKASLTLPLKEGDIAAAGRPVAFWSDWFDIMLDDGPRWEAKDHRHRMTATTPPNHFVSGWYDFMIDQLLRDYRSLVDLGHRPYLTIGPWGHVSPELQPDRPMETLAWMRAHLMGDKSGLRSKPVRFHISGANKWVDAETFPPRPTVPRTWFLAGGWGLADKSADAAADGYTYDPNDPTPSLGGAVFAFTGFGGVDQKALEARKDVLVFTSAPLREALTMIGNAVVQLHVRAENPHADFFVSLCDVSPAGRSINICDVIFRVTPDTSKQSDGTYRLDLTLHASAHCFLAGHRLRVQVSSGAHPRYARNTGTAEPIGTATKLIRNRIEILHDMAHPSAITLPLQEAARF